MIIEMTVAEKIINLESRVAELEGSLELTKNRLQAINGTISSIDRLKGRVADLESGFVACD